MIKLQTIENRERFQQAYQKIEDAYLHKKVQEPPVVVMDVNYYVSGETPDLIPDDYFSDSDLSIMFSYQVNKIVAHLERFDDDYIPLLFPWYGTVVVPSALGSRVVIPEKMDPAIEGFVLNEPGDIQQLSMPDPYQDGLMPRVLRSIDFMRENSDLPVSSTDCQGPLNIAISLCGVENLCLWMYEHPKAVHELMEFCTTVLIEWVKVQKKHAGQELDSGAFPHGIVLPKGFGGVCISDDDCVIISPHLYKEFVVPYNARVFKTFGGGTLHYCGSAEHQFENFLNTEGLTGINNFCMGDFQQVYKMQEMFENRLPIMVCDFIPLDIEEYYTELLSHLAFQGTILGLFPAPEFALQNGKYRNISRDGKEIAEQARDTVSKLIEKRA